MSDYIIEGIAKNKILEAAKEQGCDRDGDILDYMGECYYVNLSENKVISLNSREETQK